MDYRPSDSRDIFLTEIIDRPGVFVEFLLFVQNGRLFLTRI